MLVYAKMTGMYYAKMAPYIVYMSWIWHNLYLAALISEATLQMFLFLASEHGHVHFHGFPAKVHAPIF